MNWQAPHMHRTRQVNDAGKERSEPRLPLLACLVLLLLLIAACTTDAEGNIVAPVVAPAPVDGTQPAMHRGVPVGFTAEGHPFRGDPNAPITIYEYSDYECPFCARHVIQTEPALLAGFAENGMVKFVFRDMPLSSIHPNAMAASIAANCVAEQDIVLFWQMHDRIFRTQKEWAPREEALSFFA
ncbi:MAG: DsbA family protein, partial [Caldilineaceae bacterium]|nr:DsbA family protein [Caldilineaceae bacterium]